MLAHASHLCLALSAFSRQDDGQTLTEYALIMLLVALVVIGAVSLLGTEVSTLWSRISSEVIAAAA